MKRNMIKARSLVLAVFFAAGVVAVPSAQAAEFHAGAAHTILSGEQIGEFKFTAGTGIGSVTCSTFKISGTTSATTESSQVVTPELKGCKDSLGRTAHITMNGTFRHTAPTSPTGQAFWHLEGTMTIEITASPPCVFHLGPQTWNGTTYHNVAWWQFWRRKTTIATNNAQSTITGGFFSCGTSATSSTTGTLTGELEVSGSDTSGNPVSITVE